MDIIRELEKEQLKENVPEFKIGDTVKVHTRVIEGTKERIQIFEGTVIKMQNGGLSKTFTVRRVTHGTGVERTFYIHSPKIADIVVSRKGKVRRSKLYYLRDRVGKATRVKEVK